VTLLVGGKAKNLPLDELVAASRGRVRRIIAFGSAAGWLAGAYRAAGFEVHSTDTVAQAVDAAFEHMSAGEELLFSPACASFDQYLNFEERAQAFRRALPTPASQEEHSALESGTLARRSWIGEL
jgi:UDP-N-acetylmuramoylalanine--D-glutamate ligase